MPLRIVEWPLAWKFCSGKNASSSGRGSVLRGTCRGEACLSRNQESHTTLLQPFTYEPIQRRILTMAEHSLPQGWATPARRKSPRLADYDYTEPGSYFITVCTHDHSCLFGDIVVGQLELNEIGRIVKTCWADLPPHFPEVELDLYVVMPNHLHGIVTLLDTTDKPTANHTRPIVHTIVGAFKSAVTASVNAARNTPGAPLWQRSYYEHVIRSETGLNRIREYIANNPIKWELDDEHPARRQQRR